MPFRSRADLSPSKKDHVSRSLEQCLSCLFGSHNSASNKDGNAKSKSKTGGSSSKHLVDHGAPSVPLTWENCRGLYSFLALSKLPEFDDFKSSSISADTEAMFR